MLNVQSARSSLLRWLLLGVVASAAAPSVAAAQQPGVVKAPIDISLDDKTGDVSVPSLTPDEKASIDIVGATAHQDRVGARLTATVTFGGPQPVNVDTQLRVALGQVDTYGRCQVKDYGAVHLIAEMQTGHDKAIYSLATQSDVFAQIAMTRSGNSISLDTGAVPGVFDGRGWRCMRVSTEVTGAAIDSSLDDALGFAPPEDTTPAAVPPPAGGGTAAILDFDGDGIHDAIDKCPKVAGAATTGCETTPAAKAFKLGTKRLVVDRLLVRTGASCPVKVTAIVTDKGHRIGKQPMGTTTHGKFCQVVGVVKLMTRAKKVKVVVKGSGVTAVSATVKK